MGAAMQEKTGATLDRRALTRGATWTVPVMMVGSVAPATAASRCPQLSGTASGWTTTATGLDCTAGQGTSGYVTNWNNSPPAALGSGFSFTSGCNARTTGPATVTTTTTINVVAGVTYSFDQLIIGAGYGNNNANTSVLQTIRVSIGGTQIFYGATRSTTGATTLRIGASQAYNTSGTTFQPTTSGSVTVTIAFTMPATTSTRPASDDISIRLPVLTCR
ncbi:hypothetical protein [Barrientosiimonas humi]|uniref:hypothetical protein n=1 Tax=Barrientosiimonas humi TaxID=999931 RepID=UPI00370D4DC1